MKKQFIRFVLAGVGATFTTYATLIIGVEFFRSDAVSASVVGYALGVCVNYFLNYRYTFISQERHRIVLPRFLAVMVVSMLFNAIIMYAGVSWLHLHYLLAQLIAVVIVIAWSFSANRLWVFAE